MRRSFHWKRLLILLVAFGVFAGALYGVNRLQVRKQTSALRDHAERLLTAAKDDPAKRDEAIRAFDVLWKAQKDDESAVKYARLLLDRAKVDPTTANSDAALRGVEDTLRHFPEHPELRRELADLYLATGRVGNAREHLQVMFNSPRGDFRQDVELLELASHCEFVAGDTEKAVKFLEEANAAGREKNAPVEVRVRVYQQLLELLNQNKGDGQRDLKIADHLRVLLGQEPFVSNRAARVVVVRFQLFRGDVQSARQHVAQVLDNMGGRTDPESLLAAGELELVEARLATGLAAKREKLEAGRKYLEEAYRLDKKNVSVGLFLARLHDMLGDRPKAVETLRSTAEALGKIDDNYRILIDRLIDLENQDLSAALVTRIAATGQKDYTVTYFNGRLALLKGDITQGRALLEEAAPHLVRVPEFHKRAMVGLARVFEVLQNPDQQLEYCRRALKDSGPMLEGALVGEADALAKLGKTDEAIRKYQGLVTAFQAHGLRPTLVRLRLLETLRKPADSRNWELFDSDENLGIEADRSDDVRIMHAQSLAARGDRARAEQILEAIVAREPKSPFAATAWVVLARVREGGKPGAAGGVLDLARASVGDTVEVRLARADLLVFRAKPPTAAEFETLSADAGVFDKPQQFRLWVGLGQAALAAAPRPADTDQRRGLQEAAIRFLREAGKVEPRDLHSRALLVDLAVSSDRKEVIEATLGDLAALEGADGPIRNLARVVVSLPDAKKLEDKAARAAKMKELRELATSVVKQRPNWGRGYVALGRIDEAEGLNEQAVENYRKAIEVGDREEYVIRRTVELYRERKQDNLAAGVLDVLATKMVLPDDLERFRAIYELLNQPAPRAQAGTINRIAPEDSRDYKILMLRGSLLAAVRDEENSLKAFYRAVEIANPPVAETYEALVSQLVRTGQASRAKDAITEAEKRLNPDDLKTPAAKGDLYLIVGRMHEVVGDPKTAEARYQKAVEVAPAELAPRRRMVEFLMRTRRAAEADRMLATLSENAGADIARWARRYRGQYVILSQPNAYQHRGEALALIEKNLATAPDDPEDLKARAVIWTVDPVTRDEGVRVLTDFWRKGETTPDEAYLLGRLTFDLGPSKIPDSIPFFESAARPRPGVSIEHLAELVRVYLALNKTDVAETKLERLKGAAPNSWQTTREEARVLMKKSRDALLLRADRDESKKFADQARALVLKFPGHDTPEAIRAASGPLLEELGFNADAAALYRKLMTAADSPTAHVPLAVLLINERKSGEAIALAREREAKAPVLVTALLYTGAVRAARVGEVEERRISDWLDAKIRESAGKQDITVGLMGAKAELLDAQGEYDKAIAEYRRALREGPSDVVTNNLSMLLALHEQKADEAIRLMTDLINVRGPAPAFLDTRAVAYLVKGGDDVEKAVQDLEMALLQRVRPAYLYHLAWAHANRDKRLDRVRRVEEAKKVGIVPADVHPLELRKYAEIIGTP